MSCSLNKEHYTWKNALLWGNCKAHAVQVFNKENTKKGRSLHFLIAFAEIFPVISQGVSSIEKKRAGKPVRIISISNPTPNLNTLPRFTPVLQKPTTSAGTFPQESISSSVSSLELNPPPASSTKGKEIETEEPFSDPFAFVELLKTCDRPKVKHFLSYTSLEELMAYFQDKASDDTVSLEIENRKLVFNKDLLALFFPYFQAMFSGNFKESRMGIIILQNVRYAIFLEVLDHILFDKPLSKIDNLKEYVLAFTFLQISTSTLTPLAYTSLKCEVNLRQSVEAFAIDDFANEPIRKTIEELLAAPPNCHHKVELLVILIPVIQDFYPRIKEWLARHSSKLSLSFITEVFLQGKDLIPRMKIRQILFAILDKEPNAISKEEKKFLLHIAPYFSEFHELIGIFLGKSNYPLIDLQQLFSFKVIFKNLIETRLEHISMLGSFSEEHKKDFIACLPMLKRLSLSTTSRVLSEFIPWAVNLEFLEITIHDVGIIRHLRMLPHLETIYVKLDGSITDEDLHELAKLEQIKKLDLRTCPNIGSQEFQQLASLRNLKKLFISSNEINDETLPVLIKNFPRLKKLVLESCPNITPTGLRSLTDCKQLKTLKIINCLQIQSDDLESYGIEST